MRAAPPCVASLLLSKRLSTDLPTPSLRARPPYSDERIENIVGLKMAVKRETRPQTAIAAMRLIRAIDVP